MTHECLFLVNRSQFPMTQATVRHQETFSKVVVLRCMNFDYFFSFYLKSIKPAVTTDVDVLGHSTNGLPQGGAVSFLGYSPV